MNPEENFLNDVLTLCEDRINGYYNQGLKRFYVKNNYSVTRASGEDAFNLNKVEEPITVYNLSKYNGQVPGKVLNTTIVRFLIKNSTLLSLQSESARDVSNMFYEIFAGTISAEFGVDWSKTQYGTTLASLKMPGSNDYFRQTETGDYEIRLWSNFFQE